MLVVVGRIGRPHGVRGEVTVEVRTDVPDIRFAPGSVLIADPATSGPLTVSGHRWHSGRLLVTIEGVRDRNAAEGLRGVVLSADVAADDIADDPEEYYDHQLRGLTAVDPTGAVLGVVEDVIHLPGQDLLAIALSDGAEALVPFVADLVPTVDLGHRRVVIDPPPGLLELAHESNAGVQAPGASGARAGAAEADPGPAAEWGGP